MADEKKDLPSADQPSLEELKKEIQKRKKKARQSFVLVLAAAVAFLALGVAWFVSNNRVRITSGTISAGYSGVEIGSRGNQGVHDDFLKKVQKGISYLLPEQKVNDTSGGGSINWLLGEESNMKNYSDGKSFEETNAKQRKDYAIEPGTKGKLDFFVKPSQDGALSLELSLDITPYCLISADAEKETQEVEPQEVGKNTVEAALLGGHVLYFLGKANEDKTITYSWIKNGTFRIEIPDAKAGTKYDYSIYWVWPLKLSSILLNKGDSFFTGTQAEFDDKDKTGGLRDEIVADMAKNPDKYFFSSRTGAPLDTAYAEVKAIPEIHENSGKSDGTYDRQLFVDLSSYYNQADMKIGEKITFIKATLVCQGSSETKNKTVEEENEK